AVTALCSFLAKVMRNKRARQSAPGCGGLANFLEWAPASAPVVGRNLAEERNGQGTRPPLRRCIDWRRLGSGDRWLCRETHRKQQDLPGSSLRSPTSSRLKIRATTT